MMKVSVHFAVSYWFAQKFLTPYYCTYRVWMVLLLWWPDSPQLASRQTYVQLAGVQANCTLHSPNSLLGVLYQTDYYALFLGGDPESMIAKHERTSSTHLHRCRKHLPSCQHSHSLVVERERRAQAQTALPSQ